MVRKKIRNRKTPGASRRARPMANAMKPYARMLADPCGAELIQGLHSTDEGILAKLKTYESPSGNNQFGYLLWCPHYAGTYGDNKAQTVAFTSTSANGPTNVTANPAFASTDWTSVRGLTRGAAAVSFVSSTTVSDFRLVSACMRLGYTGTMSDSKGQLAYLENISSDALLLGNSGSPATIDDLFRMASHVERLGVDTHELKYRPNPTVTSTFKSDKDAVYTLGTPAASITNMSSEALRFSPTMFGFAWRGVISSDIYFELFQNIEWRPDAGSGYVTSIPQQVRPAGYLSAVLKYLDDNYPGWTHSAVRGAGYTAGRIAQMALSGSAGRRYTIQL